MTEDAAPPADGNGSRPQVDPAALDPDHTADNLAEPPAEPIVQWQPDRRHDTGALAIGAAAIGALAVGAAVVGALAIGALAIGRLAIGRAHIRRLVIDELVVKRRHGV